MNRGVKFVLAANLIVLALLALVYPHLMISPGRLIAGHQDLEGDCFACHASFTGASAERCAACHKPADIGRLTTAGLPIVKPRNKTPFHQQLVKEDCVGCHSDHAGVKRYRREGRFEHTLLSTASREECNNCHRSPEDRIHQAVTGKCGQCHTLDRWKPATFDHDAYFLLDRDHNVQCATCHERNDYRGYTCYGCHEHNADKIWREHVKEGIRDFRNCVECHRSADKHDIRGKDHGKHKDHKSKRKHHDDDD